ncbi:hypothetical protein Pla123a_30490 [Posidoniimonas polymericola]|uniref:PEP-CTERM protein-sorting domain-containing protein n=1 Tax=Posidoniimonas polymericola TaxID=2528002 RepID=A0A5C5YL65_9BACT|nr:PEP-CTERM sorting domain-containing protein [Posidoniimonas polymericola]TWT75539.1 hypothetical protein Pla123a_30490 [Posidoniimonas polymericola]
MRLFTAAAVAALLATPLARASIYGTMSNFDVFNETETEVHGAEIELEGIHPEGVSRFFPAHFANKTISSYDDGAGSFGVRVVYEGYNFGGQEFLAPTVGQSTNGHTCVGTPGCEHFGFSTVGAQPSASNFFWLDVNGNRIGSGPEQVPVPTWSYVANGGGNPILRAEVEPVEVIEQKPDSVWMKVFKTEIERAVDLAELMSGNGIVPEGIGETETEWELLEGGKMDQAEDEIDEEKVHAIIRRYEYYEYTGPYDEENEPISLFLDQDLPEPPAGELGQFISANMVAANLAPPDRVYGDFNGDGLVNAADYTAWRDNYGSEDHYLADGDDDGMIDDDDRGVWSDHYGHVLDAPPAAAGVPEPAAASLLLLAIGGCSRRRR